MRLRRTMLLVALAILLADAASQHRLAAQPKKDPKAEAEAEFQIATPQKALLILTSGERAYVEVTSATAREISVKVYPWSKPREYKAEQVNIIQTTKDIYTYDLSKARFESSRKREKERAGGIWIDKPQKAKVRFRNAPSADGELVLLSASTVWFKKESLDIFPGLSSSRSREGDDEKRRYLCL